MHHVLSVGARLMSLHAHPTLKNGPVYRTQFHNSQSQPSGLGIFIWPWEWRTSYRVWSFTLTPWVGISLVRDVPIRYSPLLKLPPISSDFHRSTRLFELNVACAIRIGRHQRHSALPDRQHDETCQPVYKVLLDVMSGLNGKCKCSTPSIGSLEMTSLFSPFGCLPAQRRVGDRASLPGGFCEQCSVYPNELHWHLHHILHRS